MADTKLTALTADTSPTSDDLTYVVNDPAGTPGSKKVTLANAITKAHGLSDGVTVSVNTGVLTSNNAATSRTNLGLVIGTNVQAYSADAAFRTDKLSAFAATTSAELAGVISDETGSGALVFANSPTLVTPDIGTPSAGTLTNATGLPISTGVSGLGSNVATFLATPSSANLISAVTDETGSGSLVFGTSPTFTTDITTPKTMGSSGLTLQGHSSINNSRITIDDQITMLSTNRTFSSATGSMIAFSGTYTLDFASATFSSVLLFNPTIVLKQSANAAGMGSIFSHTATFKNDSTVAANLGPSISFNSAPTMNSDSQTITQASATGFRSTLTLSNTTSGSLTTTTLTQFLAAGAAVGANTTLTNRYGMSIDEAATVTGTLTNQYGIDIAALTKGATTNIGIRIAKANTYTLQLSDTGGTAAGGITFGTDVQLYRSAASTLTLLAGNTLDARVKTRVTSIVSSATPTINTDNCDFVDITALAAAITSMTTNLSGTPTNGQKLTIRFKDNATPRAITWGASFEACGAALPTTTVTSKRTTVGLIWDSTTSKWGSVSVVTEA
jgi:hypothetical protein